MRRKSNPQMRQPPLGFAAGSSFDVASWRGEELFEDVEGRLYCIVGYRAKMQPSDIPYYHPSVAARHPDGLKSFRFIQLHRGTLHRTSFLSDNQYYRQIADRRLVLPNGQNSYFGVITKVKRVEDEAATRAIFGGTSRDILTVSAALASLIGRSYGSLHNLPRITFSKSRSNKCDFASCLIPSGFPYLAFEDSQYAWGHVSLHGFYKFLAFLCSKKQGNSMRAAVLEMDVPKVLLDMLISNGEDIADPLPYPDYLNDGYPDFPNGPG